MCDKEGIWPGSQMEQGMSSSTSGSAFQTKSKTTSAPTSPLKEKKSSFFGKVRKYFVNVNVPIHITHNWLSGKSNFGPRLYVCNLFVLFEWTLPWRKESGDPIRDFASRLGTELKFLLP